jgi:ureidoacrylate peracid hydrolase
MENTISPFSIINFLEEENGYLDRNVKDIAIQRWKTAISGGKTADRPFPVNERINCRNTALFIIDLQKCFVDEGAAIEVPDAKQIIPRINKLSAKIREFGSTVIYFRYIVNENIGMLKYFEKKSYLDTSRESPLNALRAGHEQFELHESLDIKDNDIVMNKERYSAVIGSDVVNFLKSKDIDTVIVTGVTTDVCVGNTAEDLMQTDFKVIVAWDGSAALSRLEHELYLARIFGLYGDVMPVDEIIERLQ